MRAGRGPGWQWGLSEGSYSSDGGTSPDQPMQEGWTWELEVVGVAGTLAQSALYLRATLHRPRLTPLTGSYQGARVGISF